MAAASRESLTTYLHEDKKVKIGSNKLTEALQIQFMENTHTGKYANYILFL